MATVVITIEKGLISNISSDVVDLRVIVADFDTEGAMEGDLYTHPRLGDGPFFLRDDIAQPLGDDDRAIIEVADREFGG
jgi:hypothetical protein